MADRYWVGGTGTWDTTLTTNWSASTGGSGGASVPTSSDNVIFDQAATYTVTMTGAIRCLSFTVSAGVVTFDTGTSPTPAISGSMSLVAATVWSSTGSITFNSTTAQTITTNGVTINGAITFNGAGGNWSLGSALTTGATNRTTLNNGTITLNGFTLTTGIFDSSNTGTRAIAFDTSNIVLTHTTAAQTVLTMAIVTGFTYTGTGGFISDASVTRTYVFGTTGGTSSNSPNLSLTGSGTAVQTFTTGSYFNSLSFGTTAFNLGTTALNIAGNLTLSSGGTFSGLTVTMVASGTITSNSKTIATLTINGLGGTFNLADTLGTSLLIINAGTFNTNNNNITCGSFWSYSSTATRAINLGSSTITISSDFEVITTGLTFNAGTSTIKSAASTTNWSLLVDNGSTTGLTFYNVDMSLTTPFYRTTFNTMTGKNTFNNLTLPTGSFVSGRSSGGYIITNDIVVNGTFTIPNSNVARYFTLTSATPGNQVTITVNGTVSIGSYINFQDINAQGIVPWTGTSLGNISNNNNITFAAGVNKYWSLAAGGNFNSIAWALTSGGTPSSANYPLPQDTIVIDNNGLNIGATINFNNDFYIKDVNMAGRTNTFTLNLSTNGMNVYVSGNWTNGSGLTSVTGTVSTVNFSNSVSGTTQSITSAGKVFTPIINVNTIGTVQLLDNLDQGTVAGSGGFSLTYGTFTLNGFTLTTTKFASSNTNNRTVVFGTTYINLVNTTVGEIVVSMIIATNFTASGAGGFRTAMSVTRSFECGSSGAPTVPPNLFIYSGASVPSIGQGSYWNLLDFTGSTCAPAANALLNLYSLTLASGGTYANLIAQMVGTGTLTGNGRTLPSLVCNTSSVTTTISGTVVVTSLTIDGGTVTLPASAQITNATVTLTSGTFNFNGGTVSASFAQTAGTVNVTATTTLAATSTYTFTSGTITLTADLTVGIFSSNNGNTRSIAFGTNNIILAHTTVAQTVLSMANATGFTWTTTVAQTPGISSGCFTATMDRTRTFVFGTTGGSITNSPNLYLSSGASIATITTGSWFNELNLGSCSFTIAATSLNLNQLITNSSTCVLTNLTANMRGTGYVYTNNSIGPLVINTSGVVYIYGTTVTCTTCTLTTGTLDLCTNGTVTCSSTFTYTSGSLINTGTINCTTFTLAGANFTFYNGYLNPSVSFVITSGTFTYGAGSGTMVAVPTFTHTAGTVNFLVAYALTVTGTYTFTAGTLNITPNMTISTGIFSSSNTNTRTIAFGTFSDVAYIQLTHTTAATVVLNMATLTGFSQTGLGGFQVADMANTRTFSVGNTAGGSVTTAPSLFFTTGASVATITTAGWFKDLYFGDTTFNPGATSLNIAGNFTLGNGIYTTVTIAMRGNGYIWNRYNAIGNSMGALTINTTGVVNPYPGYTLWCTTLTITAGTLDFTNSGGVITCSSTVTYTAGTLTLDSGALYCTTFTVNGAAFTFNAGTLNPSVSFVLTSGSLTYGGTANLNNGTLPLFTHTAGTVTLNKSMSLGSAGASGTYTFTAGTLTLTEGSILTCSIFSSTNANTRTINFGTTRYTPAYYNYPVGSNALPPSYISLTNSTAAQTVLNMAIATGFTWTGSGLFYCPGNNTGTLVFGTTGGSTTNAPNLRLDGGNVLTVTTASWFNVFNLINASYTTPATSVNVVEAFALWSNGTHTGVTIVPQLSATSILNNGNTFGSLTLNVASINIQLIESLLLSGALTLTQGTLTMGTFNVTSATFASTGTATRAILGIGTNTYTLTGAGATAFSNASATGLTMSGFTISMTSASAKTFAGGGGSFPTLNQGGAGALTITGTNTFYNITNTVQPASVTFTAATTTTFRYFSLSGNAGNLVTITSATAANHTLSMSSGVANTQYMSISRSTAQGGAGWIAATSTNGANNAGWVFAAPRFVDMGNISFDTSGGGITFTN